MIYRGQQVTLCVRKFHGRGLGRGLWCEPGFVDRVEHMVALRSLLTDVTGGRGGRAIVVDSVPGIGKSALLRAFEAEAAALRAGG
jgi:hypothetical protein